MNVLQVVPELNVGGVETGTLDLARALVKLGHKAVVVSSGGRLVKDLEAAGAVHYRLPVHKKSFLAILATAPKLARIIRKEEIDIVHARSRAPAWAAYFASRATGRVFITTCHGYYKKHFFSHVMGWGKKVIVISNAIGRHMIDDFGVPYERLRLIPRSVDTERFTFVAPDRKRQAVFNVGIVGRLTPIKGHLHFIKAMAIVSRAVPRLKIWIVGDAPPSKEGYKEEVKVLARRLGLWQNTEFLGTQREIPEILQHLDCLVLATTTQEAFGRVIIEAQASGVPVVATSVGGVVDIVEDAKTGLLVPAADPRRMAEAVLKIYSDPALALRLAENAALRVKERYTVNHMVQDTLDTYREALSNFKVLIVKLSSLGDVILSTAAIKAIREKLPAAYRISVLVGEESKEVLLRCPYVDEVMVSDFRNKDRGLFGLWKLGRALRKEHFDIVVDLQNNRKSHFLGWLTMAPRRYGYDNGKLGFLLTDRLKDEKPALDPVAHQFRVLKMMGIESSPPALELWPDAEDERYAQELLSSEWVSGSQKLVGISVSASPRWLTKNWPLANMRAFCEEISRRDMRVVLTGTQKDLPLSQGLSAMLRNAKVINACGRTTVNQLASLIRRCSVFVSADSASLHIAASMQVPFVALFGPTDPARHLPPAQKCVVIRHGLECSPCYKARCAHPRCMEGISAAEVVEAVERLLA